MKPPLSLVALLFVTSTAMAQEPSPSPSPSPLPQIFVADGQLLNAPLKMFVSFANIDQNMKPRLWCASSHAKGRTDIKGIELEPFVVAANQTWTEKVADQNVERSGTLLMFDLSQFPIDWWKSATRVTPVLTWKSTEPGNPETKLVGQSFYLGQRLIAILWTVLAVGLLIVLIVANAKVKEEKEPADTTAKKPADTTAKEPVKKTAVYLLAGPDNYMSLWRTQLAVWTVAVGSMIFLFGVIQLEVPRIPESLVALMGLSVATGGLGNLADTKKTSRHKKDIKPQLSHLFSSYNEDSKDHAVLSVSKAQMVFWTGIILVLFVLKSFSRGELWDVPWELVALTGVSQAGYVTDKAVEGKKERDAKKNS